MSNYLDFLEKQFRSDPSGTVSMTDIRRFIKRNKLSVSADEIWESLLSDKVVCCLSGITYLKDQNYSRKVSPSPPRCSIATTIADDNDSLRDKLKKTNEMVINYKKEIAKLKNDVKDKESELEEAKSNSTSNNTADIECLQDTLDDLREEIKEYDICNKKWVEFEKENEKVLKEYEITIKRLQKSLTKATEDLVSSTEESTTAENSLKSQLADANRKIKSLEKSIKTKAKTKKN